MIATLPMYLRAETRAATDAFWAAIRDALRGAGVAAPETLDHAMGPHEAWSRRDLVLSQICNLPYRTGFADKVTLVAAPDLGLSDAPAGTYYSVIVARAEDPRDTLSAFDDAVIAINSGDSQSGWGAPAAAAARFGIAYSRALVTGAHVDSARAVAERHADLAGIDVATWRLIRRHDRFADRLRVLARTPPTPALSYVTARGSDPAAIRAAMIAAYATLEPDTREALGLHGIVAPDPQGYASLPVPPPPPG